MDRGLIDEQIAYYEARAVEYDTTTHDVGHPTDEHARAFEAAIEELAPAGTVLDIACGTGNWTRRLIPYADSITAIDASPSMLERARKKLGTEKVRFLQTDVFEWEADAEYDVVFFSFWLSHVPTSLFEDFWHLVDRCLKRNGRVFVIDEAPHHEWDEDFLGDELVRRRLSDGSEHRAIKKFWDPDELSGRLTDLGWALKLSKTGPFYFGVGRRIN